MGPTLQFFAAMLLFLLGLRLSAFFSGTETGFYRVSYLRLTIDAHAGDRIARRLMWFAHHPSYFVATTLVGNNVANYLTTLAIGLAVVVLFPANAGWIEIAATLLLTPVVFLCGELLPKNLYYRSPLTFLRRDSKWFAAAYKLFYPISLPLVGITKLFERFSRSANQPLELVLGRNRLVQVLSQGHRAGILTDVQSRLVNGIMHTAGQSVRDTMTPLPRVLGAADDVAQQTLLETARKYGLSHVLLHRADNPSDWYGYVCVAEVTVSREPLKDLLRELPEVSESTSKLETLLKLRETGSSFARVTENGSIIGIVNERGLIEQLFRPPQTGLAAARV